MDKNEFVNKIKEYGYTCEIIEQVPIVLLDQQAGWEMIFSKVKKIGRNLGYTGSMGIKTSRKQEVSSK